MEPNELPKIIWMTWFQGLDEAPELVKICHKSWVRLNPDWVVIFLDRNSIRKYFDLSSVVSKERRDITRQQASDVLRLNLLSLYGGVWVDATVYCTKPLDEWLPGVIRTGFFVFRDPASDRILGNWFIASVPGCQLTESFCKAYNKLIKDTVFTRQSHRPTKRFITSIYRFIRKRGWRADWLGSPVFVKTMKAYPYFLFHFFLAHFLKGDPVSHKIFYEMPYITASLPRSVNLLMKRRAGHTAIRKRVMQLDPPMQKLDWRKAGRYRTKSMDMSEYLPYVTGT